MGTNKKNPPPVPPAGQELREAIASQFERSFAGDTVEVIAQMFKRYVQPTDDAFYAAYANHCAIQGKLAMTWFSWRRAGKPKEPPATADLSREGLREAIKAEVNKEYRQLDGWARQSDVEAAIDRALAAQPGVREGELSEAAEVVVGEAMDLEGMGGFSQSISTQAIRRLKRALLRSKES